MSRFIDGDFTFAREIEGSGIRAFSQYNTNDFIVERQYAQQTSTYKQIPISSPDFVYKKSYLVEEAVLRIDAYLTYFKRTYMSIPSPRTESKNIVYSFPGQSLYSIAVIDGKAVYTYDRYGSKRPASVFRSASFAYTYSLGAVPVGLPTQILFDGSPVDFVGLVYSPDALTYLGATNPVVAPNTFIVSDNCRPVRGDIWERERVTVSLSGSSAPISG